MKKLFTIIALTVLFSMNAQTFWFQGTGSNAIQTINATASGTYSTAMGRSTEASGYASTAMGYLTTASGNSSTAMGGNTIASAFYSTAMGANTTASGAFSTAMGDGTIASGSRSTAMGRSTTARDYGSLVIGQYNSSGSSATSADSFSTANTAFVIGNGANAGSSSDAFKVMFNGDTYVSNSLYLGGTEITSTATELNLLTGATSLGTGILSPVTENSNTGVRLSTAVAANHGDIGSNAVDLSYSNSASTTRGATGDSSTAMGDETTASGSASTAMGASTTASGSRSTAMGTNTTASGTYSTAMGGYTTASAFYSTAMGGFTTASGTYSTAMGRTTTASGYASTAMGFETTASGENSTAMGGGTEASGTYSTAMGKYTTASDYGSLVIGQYNSSGSSATSANSFSTANTAFVIGNGADSGLSDAFSILFDGTTNIAGSVTADSFIKDGGVSTEFLKADGSVDSSVYITAAEVTPQADSDWASTVSPTQILNKPTTISTQQADEITANTLKRSYPVLDEDKLATIETGAQVNVQSDWDATTGDALILNKPVIPTIVPQADSDWASTVSPTQILNKPTTISTQQADEITANTLKRSYPVLDEDKLATIETGAQVNVQSDWDATTGDALILNKPVIPTIVPQADSDWASTVSPTQILNKPTTISTQQADEITANTLKRSYPVLDEDKLATIETGAQVNVQSDWDATTGDALILNKPVITDDQQLANFILSADSLLSLSIQDGNVVSVNLAPLLADLEAENEQQQNSIDDLETENDELTSIVSNQQSQIDDLIIRMEIREECACDPTLGNGDNTLQPDKAYLLQNIPNPFNNTTSVGYFVPYTNAKAHIVISTMAGQIVHNMELSNLGVGAVSIDNSRMASAVYLYTLYVDGKRIDTKRMIVE